MDKKEKLILAKDKIKKFILGGALVFGLGTSQGIAAQQKSGGKSGKSKTEVVSKKAKTDYSAIKIEKYSDIEKLFEMSLNIIFAEAILEEVPMSNAYDDWGRFKGSKNTLGVGSTYSPINMKDYNNPNANWYHLASNQKTFASRKASNEDMLKLLIGWGRYRHHTQDTKTKKIKEHNTILQRLFNGLKGCSLRPNEFAALYMAVYNNENNIAKLCPVIKKNYSNPIMCANAIMLWWKTGASNPGLKDRCEFEACVYLNADNFCEAMLDMYTCPSKRSSCVNVKGVKEVSLDNKNYKTWVSDAKKKYLKVVYHNGKRTGDICNSCAKYFKNPLYEKSDKNKVSLQKQYDIAIVHYNKQEYKKALEEFLLIEKQGGLGCDLFNDIAITAFNLKDYKLCIDYCRKVLETSDTDEYAKACYNAGRAYEEQKNYAKAVLNYTKALEYYNKYGVARSDLVINYKKVYSDALANATKLQQQQSKIDNKAKTR